MSVLTETKLSGIIKAVVGEYVAKGFTAHEESDEFVLEHDGEPVVRMSSGRATITDIRLNCLQHLVMEHGISY